MNIRISKIKSSNQGCNILKRVSPNRVILNKKLNIKLKTRNQISSCFIFNNQNTKIDNNWNENKQKNDNYSNTLNLSSFYAIILFLFLFTSLV